MFVELIFYGGPCFDYVPNTFSIGINFAFDALFMSDYYRECWIQSQARTAWGASKSVGSRGKKFQLNSSENVEAAVFDGAPVIGDEWNSMRQLLTHCCPRWTPNVVNRRRARFARRRARTRWDSWNFYHPRRFIKALLSVERPRNWW